MLLDGELAAPQSWQRQLGWLKLLMHDGHNLMSVSPSGFLKLPCVSLLSFDNDAIERFVLFVMYLQLYCVLFLTYNI